MRVVSLLPSATEIVCALGAESELVGVSHECDYPVSVRGLPVLTSSRLSSSGDNSTLHGEVRRLVEEALAIYRVDERRLFELQPDLIVTQDLCSVCAVSLGEVEAALGRLRRTARPRLLSLHPTCLSDVWDDVERVADALGRPAAGRTLRAELEAEVAAIAGRARRAATRPSVVSLEWLDPPMLGGTWMPELIELAGGTPLGVRAGELAPSVEPARLEELCPDVVLVKPCGFELARTVAEEAALLRVLSAKTLDRARVYLADGNAYFNRSGPRLVESLQILAACLHPQLFADFRERHSSSFRRWTS